MKEPVAKGPSDRFGAEVQTGGRLPADVMGREVVEDVEDLERGDPARRARGQGEIEAAVATRERRAHAHLVRGEVAFRQQTVARGHLVVDRLGEGASVEGVRPLTRDQGEAPRHVRVCHALARLERGRAVDRAAVPQIDACRLGEGAQLLDVARGRQRLIPIGAEAVARQRDRRRQHVGELHRPVPLERQGEPGDRPGHGHRPMAILVRCVLDARPREEALRHPTDQPEHGCVRARRGLAVEVDRHGLAARREMHEHRARAGERGHEGLDDGHRERGRHGRVHGVAALLEDRGAHAGAERMLGDHQAPRGQRCLLRHDQLGLDHRAPGLRQRRSRYCVMSTTRGPLK